MWVCPVGTSSGLKRLLPGGLTVSKWIAIKTNMKVESVCMWQNGNMSNVGAVELKCQSALLPKVLNDFGQRLLLILNETAPMC